MAKIPLFPNTPLEASQMRAALNQLIMEINKVIAPLPDPPVDTPGGDTGATGATGMHTGLTGTGNPNPGPLPPIHPQQPDQSGGHKR